MAKIKMSVEKIYNSTNRTFSSREIVKIVLYKIQTSIKPF